MFGRDGTLFITQGDRSITEGRMQAQKMDSLLGKIVRINADGSIPKDNPFVGKEGVRPEIWSFGHRNIQAATLHPTTGELWEVEHGTRGGDEVNIARKGKDYGWPTIAYGIEYQGPPITGGIQQKEGMEQPRLLLGSEHRAERHGVLHRASCSRRGRTACSSAAWAAPTWCGLSVKGEQVVGEERLLQDLQPNRERFRDVRQGPDGAIYLLTDSAEGPHPQAGAEGLSQTLRRGVVIQVREVNLRVVRAEAEDGGSEATEVDVTGVGETVVLQPQRGVHGR